jgi:amino-acid N-acetyltransferase
LREEDIPELLAMIGRSVRRAHLVPRDYDEIVERRPDFLVLSVDDNVVGCVAVHSYAGNVGEVACLYVKQSHEGIGYGHTLVAAAEEKARALGLERVFALTNRASQFFVSLGYRECPLERVPEARRKKLVESSRQSAVLEKDLRVN